MSEGSFGETAMGNEEEVDKGKGDAVVWRWVNNGSPVSSNAATVLGRLRQ